MKGEKVFDAVVMVIVGFAAFATLAASIICFMEKNFEPAWRNLAYGILYSVGLGFLASGAGKK